MKLKVKVPVFGLAARDGGLLLTSDGLPMRAFSKREADSFIDSQRLVGHMQEVSACDLGEMELEVDLELSEENLAALRGALLSAETA